MACRVISGQVGRILHVRNMLCGMCDVCVCVDECIHASMNPCICSCHEYVHANIEDLMLVCVVVLVYLYSLLKHV